ncbi:MAG: hypothetical protein ACI4C1_09230 [Lachnospiraceae bacterium]
MEDIKKNLAGMNMRQKVEYIITYYWWHILLITGAVCLLLFLVCHYILFREQPAQFTCILANQRMDRFRDEQLQESFAEFSGLDAERIVFDSNYIFSYGDFHVEGANESSYEKFFFKWRNHEMDAVIMTKDLMKFSEEMGGTFIDLSEYDTYEFVLYEEDGVPCGIELQDTPLMNFLDYNEEETLLLLFPIESKNREQIQTFLDFLHDL